MKDTSVIVLNYRYCYRISNFSWLISLICIVYLEFHRGELVDEFSHVVANHGPRDFVLGLGSRFHCMASQIVEADPRKLTILSKHKKVIRV